MARIKKFAPEQKLSSFQTFLVDDNPNSDYFRITEFKDTFTGGKNGFLIEGSEYLKESTEIKIEILDVEGNPVYYEPGNGIPEYYEGISKLIAVYIYEDTPIGLGKITILGELKEYDENGVKRQVPDEWKGAYNVKWERTFQINKKLANEDRVRFYRRPKVSIDEIVKPIFNNNAASVTQIGSLDGTPLVPIENTNLSNFTLPTSYRLNVNSGNNWTGSVVGQTIQFDNINYAPIVNEVVNDSEIIVSPPYTINNIVKSFTNEDYSVSFNYLEGVNNLATALTGSFAKINITDMKTFVGDAARIKVFRRSQSNLTDYEFVQEIQLESNELLRDIVTKTSNEETYGFFTEPILSEYWLTSSNDFDVSFNRNFLYNSAKLDSTEENYFFTTESFSIQSGVEYTLDFNVRKETANSTHYLKAFLSGSLNGTPKSQTIVNIPSANALLQKQNYNENIIADSFDTARLYFEVEGSDWYINNVSLKASQETSFSPDEITFIQNVPKTLAKETFDYRFEFYDINNNYIPILVEQTKTFDGGNLNLFNKEITITPNNLYFAFDSASAPANPLPPTTIIFDIETRVITGSVAFTSGAYDEFGNLISDSEYAGGQYPGLLRDIRTNTPTLNVADFTGSRDDILVQYIRFTGEVEGVSDEVVITRVQDGKGGVNFEIRPYRGTIIKNKSNKDLEVQAIRIDGVNEILLRDGLPQRGFSDAKLRIVSSSINPITSEPSSSYLLLSEATAWGAIRGVSAGLTGSGEIDYNAVFNRDSIDGELTVFLMDGPTSSSILTSLILTDLQDGLASGFVTFDTEQFGIKPRIEKTFTPTIGRVTGSFYLRGRNDSPISGTLDIYPSMSRDPETLEPFYYMFYVTGAFDRRIGVEVTDFANNVIDSGIPGVTSGVSFYDAVQTKQLTTKFTYTEDITSASISVDKTFFAAPDGLPGADSIVVNIDPNPVTLNADQRGRVFNYTTANTDITVTQGTLPLIFTGSQKPGTFTTESVTPTGITYSGLDLYGSPSMSFNGFNNMTDLTASVLYRLEIHPYFTASYYTGSFTQRFKKSIDGAAAINVELEPIAVTLAADEIGKIRDNSAAITTLKVKQGDEYLEYNPGPNVLPGTFSASLSSTNITILNFSASNLESTDRSLDDTLHYSGFTDFTSDSANVDYSITVYPLSITNGIVSGSQSFTKKQVFTKSREGVKSRSINLSATTTVVNYNADGVVTSPVDTISGEPTSIFLTAEAFNTTSSLLYYQFYQNGFAVTFPQLSNEFEVGSGDFPALGQTQTFKVELRDGANNSPVKASTEITIAGVQGGANNYQVFLTNPAASVLVETDGSSDVAGTGTQIKAFKGTQELTNVSTYSSPTLDLVGDPIGSFGEFSASLFSKPLYINQPNIPIGNPATIGDISIWSNPQDNKSAVVVYKVDIENGRATYFLSQSLTTVFEGAVGPGLVMRGQWNERTDYIGIVETDSQRIDAVIYPDPSGSSGETHYFRAISGSGPTTLDGTGATVGFQLPPAPENNNDYWQYLGQQDFFVAAKMAIFEESFVKNTINVGIPPNGNPNANIAIVGGTDEPYIAIGQTGTQGYAQPGVFLGLTNDGGPAGTSGTTGLLSLKSVPAGGQYNSLEWDGETLTIRGAIRQTSAGVIEPSLRGTWASGTTYYPQDLVQYLGETWSSNTQHTSTNDTNASTGVPGSGPWTIAAGAGKGVTLLADSYVIAYDAAGANPTPSGTLKLIASSSNFVNGFYKFTGGGAVFTDETSFTDGLTANTDEASLTIPSSYFSTPLQFRVGVAEGDQEEKVSDTITITAVQPGADSSPMYFITSTAGGTQIKNGSGTITLQAQQSDSTGLNNLASPSAIKIYSGSNLITTISGVTGTDYNPTIDASAIFGTMYLTLKDGSNTYDTITLLDVTDGLGGGSFISPNLKSTRNPVTNNYTPSFLSLTASFYDTSGTEYQKAVQIIPNFDSGTDYMYYNTNGSINDTEISLVIDNGDGTVFSGTGIGNKLPTKDVVVTATFTDPATSQTSTMVETVYIISDGADGLDAITVVLSNSAHTLAADSGGTVTSYAGSGTTISVYEGINQLNHDGTGTSNGTFKIVAVPTNITVGSITDDGDDALVGNHSSMTDVSASIQYQITGSRVSGSLFTSQVVQTLTKAVAGIAGTNAKTIRLSATNQAFVVASDGSISPNYITLSVNKQNTTATTNWSTSPSVTLYDAPTGGSTTTTGDTVYLRKADFGANTAVTITATADGLSDEITIVKVAEGTNGITILNSNQSHTVPASSAGVVSSFAGSGTKIEVYEGATKLDYDGGIPPPDGAFSIGNVVITPTGDFTIDSTPDEGADYIEYGDGTAMDNATDVVTIRYGITGSRANGEEFRADTIQTLTKAVAGVNGTNGTDGAAGEAAGIVYAGDWTLTPQSGSVSSTNKVVYLGETDLKYVVKYESGASNYWVCATTHRYTGPSSGGSGWVVGDVTLESGTYYICISDTADPPSVDPPGWSSIGSSIEPGTWGAGWDAFGAEFTSVATDILFAQDVYANKTVNIGSKGGSPVIALNADSASGYLNPRIQIGQDVVGGEGFGDDGIYFGYSGGNPVLSMVSGSTFLLYESGSIQLSDASFVGTGSIIEGASIRVGRNLGVSVTASNAYNFTVSTEGVVSASQAYIEGTIAASAGNIGNWVIDPIVNGAGGVLRDNDSELVFDPNIPEIQIYSESIQRVFIGTGALTSTAAVSSSFDWTTPEPAITSATITSNALNTNSVRTNVYTAVSDNSVSLTPGTYEFLGIDWPTGTIAEPSPISTAGTSAYPNYQPSFAGQIHGGFSVYFQQPRVIGAALYLEVVDANNGNALIGSTLLRNNIADGDFPATTIYYAENVGDTGGGDINEQSVIGSTEQSVIGSTEITLSDGTIKLAKDCTIDDTILAWSDTDNKWVSANISKIYKRDVTEIYKVVAGDYEVEVSDTHGFWLFGTEGNSGKVTVKNIKEGITKIWIKDGDTKKEVIVDKVEKIEKEEEVITFTIPTYVNYVSNNIISHNVIGGLYWNQTVTSFGYTAGSARTLNSGTNESRNISISTGTTAAKLRYRLFVFTNSGNTINVASNGTLTYNYYQQQVDIAQTNTGGKEVYFASSRMNTDGVSIEKSNNFVELKPSGIQIVTSENIFVRARRKDSLVNTTALDAELFRVQGGISYFSALAEPYSTAISVEGHIRPAEAGWDLGGSTSVLKFKNLNGLDIEDLAVSKSTSGYARLFDNLIIQWVRTTLTSAAGQGSGTWPTPFDTIYGAVVSKGNNNTTYLGDNNSVNVSYTTTNWYVDFNENGTRTNYIIAIGVKA